MNRLPLSVPVPPRDAVVPADVQLYSLVFSAVVLVLALEWARRISRQHHTAMPFWLLLAGFCAVPLEAVVCNLGHAWHAAVGQITLYAAVDRSIPLYFGFVYAWYFGGVYVAVLPRIIDNGFTTAGVWKLYGLTCLIVYAIEPYFIHHGMWMYYGNQPLWIWKGGQPLFWTSVNATCILVPLTLIKLFYPLLTGWKQAAVLVISPVGAFAGHLGAGFPWYLVANSTLESDWLAVQLAGVASILLSLVIVAGCAQVLVSKSRLTS